MTDRPELSVVVPCFRTGPTIASAVDRLTSALEATGLDWEVVVVTDGDREAYECAVTRRSERIRVAGYPENRGKGFALRLGIMLSRGELVAFLDADMQYPPEELGRMVRLLRLYDADIVVGDRRHPLSRVQYPRARRIQSYAYQVLVRLLFHVRVRDTQAGLKLLRRQVATDVVGRAVVKRFAFDVELLAIATHLGHRRILEAPLDVTAPFNSTVDAKAAANVLVDTFATFYRLRVVGGYDDRTERAIQELESVQGEMVDADTAGAANPR